MCDCADRLDAELASHNAQIMLPIFGPQKPSIVLIKKDEKKRGKLPYLLASFCPFCGEKYPKGEAA